MSNPNTGPYLGENFAITVNTPPVANAGSDQTVECTSPTTTAVTLNGTLSSDPDGDPGNRQIRSLLQELLRVFKADPGEVILVRHANHPVEQPTEVILAQAGLGRGLLEVQRGGMMLLDVFDGPLDAKMRQRGLVDGKGIARFSASSLDHDHTFRPGPEPLVPCPACFHVGLL